MNWILDNIQVLIGVAAAVAFWLNKRREERLANEEETDPGLEPDGEPATKRRLPPVLEEARRRLLEELRLPVEPETIEEAPPLLPERFEELPAPPPPPLPVAPEPAPARRSRAPLKVIKQVSAAAEVLPRRNARLKAALRSPDKVREAWLLKEILDKPVCHHPPERHTY